MTYLCECKYCGYTWKIGYIYPNIKLFCDVCKDKNIIVNKIDANKGDVFGYNSQDPKEDAYFTKKSNR